MTMTNAEWCIKNGYKFSDIHIGVRYKGYLRTGEFVVRIKNEKIDTFKSKLEFADEALKEWLDMEHEETEAKHNDVKHAYWIDMGLDDVHVCSHCDKVVVFMNGNEPSYCPYCGARMDGKDNE